MIVGATATTPARGPTPGQDGSQLEHRFGDPFDDANPVGFRSLLEADEQHSSLPAAEDVLDAWGCNEEFVPSGLGGRWRQTDTLVRRLRPVFRRDAALGLGYGVTTLMAAVNVWTAGSSDQQHRMARELAQGHKVAVAFHELDHGNDFLRNTTMARRTDRWRLDGGKQVINNIDRARSLLVFARTGTGNASRDHSLFWVHKDEAATAGLRMLPRYETAGMRGCLLGGAEFSDWAVPDNSLVGAEGSGAHTALRAFQVTRAALPGLALGQLDTALHVVTRFAGTRRLYGHTVGDLPHARTTIAAAFADLLAMDCLWTAAARLLHLAPGRAGVASAAVKYLVPRVLQDALYDLSQILGARFYLREGAYAVFGKICRDIPLVALGHAGGAACLLSIIPHLPVLARRGWQPIEAPAALFDSRHTLPDLKFEALAIPAGTADPLAAALAVALEQPRQGRARKELLDAFAHSFAALREQCTALPPVERGPLAGAETFRLAERYAVLLAVSTCLGVARGVTAGALQDPEVVHAVLLRLAARLGHGTGVLPAKTAERVYSHVTQRAEEGLSMCLDAEPIFR
ncbi:acyl-CoA dehydrogenase [Lipingzhangella sp. LS1_29]|uniref:Acyl-CoA dehydrogenase n=1 Tax=Lipingzhangella rawalii TaxID=2055835 RepID=A0ABU2H6H7_9ACTN|nr:acyl-CoA dehydrogenase [Lipingzhangella rawalii]MDS1270908.1 acyl-CoA dehydrogenase [Lipingzhangella rawalii]